MVERTTLGPDEARVYALRCLRLAGLESGNSIDLARLAFARTNHAGSRFRQAQELRPDADAATAALLLADELAVRLTSPWFGLGEPAEHYAAFLLLAGVTAHSPTTVSKAVQSIFEGVMKSYLPLDWPGVDVRAFEAVVAELRDGQFWAGGIFSAAVEKAKWMAIQGGVFSVCAGLSDNGGEEEGDDDDGRPSDEEDDDGRPSDDDDDDDDDDNDNDKVVLDLDLRRVLLVDCKPLVRPESKEHARKCRVDEDLEPVNAETHYVIAVLCGIGSREQVAASRSRAATMLKEALGRECFRKPDDLKNLVLLRRVVSGERLSKLAWAKSSALAQWAQANPS